MIFDFSHVWASDNSIIDKMYSEFKNNPKNVDVSWQQFFLGVEFAQNALPSDSRSEMNKIEYSQEVLEKEMKVHFLIQSYRARGHLISTTNPIRPRKDRHAQLNIETYGLAQEDLERNFHVGKIIGLPDGKLKDILKKLNQLYASNIGVEYMHIGDSEVRRWFRERFESSNANFEVSMEKKKRILTKLNEAVAFENFLHTKYVGQKRFSLEGGENTIPALDSMINYAGLLGVEEVHIGMAHRGRLNVLSNIMGKTYDYIFNEFEGTAVPDLTMGDGDVKYHMGFSSQIKTTSGKTIYLKLLPNPSHLEAVDAVALGYARAQADLLYQEDSSKILPIIIHGDAAVAGQGIVYETIQMSGLRGYNVGGALHFVINNQIGFTTDFDDARTSTYCTSVARTLDVPIIHVNGDDAEAVNFAVELATEFRMKFKKDIFVDMVCYRRHGHNESDEPKYTQPGLYKQIGNHPNPREVYKTKLISLGQIEAELALKMEEEFKNLLQDRFQKVKQNPLPYLYQKPDEAWRNLRVAEPQDFNYSPKNTNVELSQLEKVLNALTKIPDNCKPIKKVQKLLEERKDRFTRNQLDWAICELMAYGTLLLEGVDVRMSGQDCIRGTFSHRHAKIFDEETNNAYSNLNFIADKQAKFRIFNSFLSEYAVLGYEYGYSLGNPTSLNIWEAQFGDFANGAQTIIDQFISSGESKWRKQSGLMIYLPHGYEGQGPEHSNARPERFLQLAAEYNMIVANCTTPANLFHLIRRQQKFEFRKPVVLFTPKSLLRHPQCLSKVEELTQGNFLEIIDDNQVKPSEVRRVIWCSGKIYFDLLAYQQKENRKDIAIVRLEQLYPMAEVQVNALLEKYKGANMVWVQEEPKNMGAWTFLLRYTQFERFDLISRKSSASPATGYSGIHGKEQQNIITQAFKL